MAAANVLQHVKSLITCWLEQKAVGFSVLFIMYSTAMAEKKKKKRAGKC